MNFEKERDASVRINLTPEEISKKYGDELKPEMEGKLYDVISSLFNHLCNIKKIIVPGEFRSSRGAKAIKCSLKANEGLLYPLRSSLVFIHKPILYIRHQEIKSVEFSRIGEGTTGVSRSFDVTLTKARDDTQVTFLSIDKEEQKVLMAYFKKSEIKTRITDPDGAQREAIASDSDLDVDDDGDAAKASGRRAAARGKRSAN